MIIAAVVPLAYLSIALLMARVHFMRTRDKVFTLQVRNERPLRDSHGLCVKCRRNTFCECSRKPVTVVGWGDYNPSEHAAMSCAAAKGFFWPLFVLLSTINALISGKPKKTEYELDLARKEAQKQINSKERELGMAETKW